MLTLKFLEISKILNSEVFNFLSFLSFWDFSISEISELHEYSIGHPARVVKGAVPVPELSFEGLRGS
jgi:hypothetical protein